MGTRGDALNPDSLAESASAVASTMFPLACRADETLDERVLVEFSLHLVDDETAGHYIHPVAKTGELKGVR